MLNWNQITFDNIKSTNTNADQHVPLFVYKIVTIDTPKTPPTHVTQAQPSYATLFCITPLHSQLEWTEQNLSHCYAYVMRCITCDFKFFNEKIFTWTAITENHLCEPAGFSQSLAVLYKREGEQIV